MGEEFVDALVEIHAVDWQAAGLEGFGKPSGYLERQLRRFGGRGSTTHARGRPPSSGSRAGSASTCPSRRPGDGRPRRLPARQRDVRPGRAGPSVAVLRLGDGDDRRPARRRRVPPPLWSSREDRRRPPELSPSRASQGSRPAPSSSPATRRAPAGAVTDMGWYQTLALWKAAMFMEGNYRRAISGTTDDPYLKGFGDAVLELAERARTIARAA